MASLVLRNGIWHIRYRDKRGKSRSQSTKLHTSEKNDILAKKKLASFEVDLLRGEIRPGSPLIGSMLDDVLNDYRTNGKKSIKTTESHIDRFLRPWFGEMRADRFAADDWREYVAYRQEGSEEYDPAANGTINRERSALMRAFSLAYQAGRISNQPYIPRLKEAAPRSGFITRKEMESLCRHLPEYLKPVVRFGFLTGWRLGEILQLQWRHIDFDAGEIRLDPGSTKNGEARVFPMTSEIRGILEAIAPARPAVNSKAVNINTVDAEAVTTTTPLIFHRKGEPVYIYHSWRKAARAIGRPGLIFHDLRRSAVREFIRQGMDERLAMQLTGHRTNDVFKRYRIIAESDLERARELMEGGAQTVRKDTGNA